MINCTFAGHRMGCGVAFQHIEYALERLLDKDDNMCCYVGGMGEFDTISSAAVRELKRKYPQKDIQLILVLPYMKQAINNEKMYYETFYDNVIVPIELVGLHYKRAISARNRWLVDNADYIIAMLWREYGGAYDTVQYARRKNKQIIMLDIQVKETE